MAMTLRFTPEQERRLTTLASQRNMSKQQLMALALDEIYERSVYIEKLDAAIDGVLVEYADAIERLGK